MNNTLYGLLFIAMGAFTIFGVVINNIGMNTRRAQAMVRLIGETGTKIFYTAIGALAALYGLMVLLGVATLG